MDALIPYLWTVDGLPDAEAAAALAATQLHTPRPIPLASLTPLLRKGGQMDRLTDFVAGVGTLANQAGLPGEVVTALRAGLRNFLGHVNDPRQINLDTTDPAFAVQTAQAVGGLMLAGELDAAAVAAIYALGGGRVVPADVSADDVTAARATLARRELIDALIALMTAEQQAARTLYMARNAKVAAVRNDPTRPVPATLAELDAGSE